MVEYISKSTQPGTGLGSPSTTSSSGCSSRDSPACLHTTVDETEEYHGPISLSWLCRLFRDSAASLKARPDTTSDDERHDELENILDRMRDCARVDHVLPEQRDGGVSRPPKQQLMKAQARYFQQVDCVTDVFVHQNFLAQLERIYAVQGQQPFDETWIVCFQAIILLAIGSELLGASSCSVISGLASSVLVPSSVALVTTHLLMAPRLVNVQALILLSVLAQQQDSQARSELVFAQACMLAKAMELHTSQTILSEASPEERQERWKVCRSLYIRDKAFAVTRGSVSWLPDANINRLLGITEGQDATDRCRIHLASLQAKVFALSQPGQTLKRTSKRLRTALRAIESGLLDLAQSQSIFVSWTANHSRAALRLDFLATRIAALQESPCPLQQKIVRADARASCMVLLLACGKGSQTVQQLAEVLMLTAGAAYPPQSMRQMTELAPTAAPGDALCDSITADVSPVTILALLDAFPPSAYFMMVREVLWPGQDGQIADAEGDLWLLQQVQACYHEHAALMPVGSYRRKLGSVFQLLLRVIVVAQEHKASALEPSQVNTLSGTPESSLSVQKGAPSTLKASPQAMDLEMPSFSAWPTPNSMQDPSWGDWADFTSSGDVGDMLLLPPHLDGMTGNLGDLTPSNGRDHWTYSPPLEHGGRKRPRIEEHSGGLDSNAQRGLDSFMTSPEPFTFSITPARV
ncbi:hypothetical protein LTR59_015947 [Friedmanniomyces endolithicus]|nr:hypothetical protein LTR94_016875 [Friedmanniomyces endolithicus]KAK0771804.1 hypothetical protein LTR59_015947 [Friedmanniomyces endolithicus]KAK0772227.1 hypothetical protein LTR38_016960 [Friedmanniomyces endolithicus]